MKKHSFLNPANAIFVTLLIFVIGCGQGSSTPESTAKTDSPAAKEVAATPSPAPTLSPIVSEFLDTLFTDATPFRDFDPSTIKKITLRFYILNKDALTLHGWINDSNSSTYNPTPDIKFTNDGKTAIQFGAGSYFGNLVLYKDDLRKIRKKAKDNDSKYVVFIPLDPAATNGQISYDIHVTDKTGTLANTKLVPTGTQTNPSPPRNAN